jgi:hypothetical protein
MVRRGLTRIEIGGESFGFKFWDIDFVDEHLETSSLEGLLVEIDRLDLLFEVN